MQFCQTTSSCHYIPATSHVFDVFEGDLRIVEGS